LARDAEGAASLRHCLTIQKLGDKPQALVHDRTLLPRHPHLPHANCMGEVLPMCPVRCVTYVSGRSAETGAKTNCFRKTVTSSYVFSPRTWARISMRCWMRSSGPCSAAQNDRKGADIMGLDLASGAKPYFVLRATASTLMISKPVATSSLNR